MRLPLLHVCVSRYTCVLIASAVCFRVVGSSFVLVCLYFVCSCIRLSLCVARLRFRLYACRLHVCFWCVVGSFVCSFILVFRVIAYEFAFVCCKVAFHITRVCRLHLCYVFVFCLCVCLCLYARFACDCVAHAAVCCQAAFHSTRVCRLHVCFAFVF